MVYFLLISVFFILLFFTIIPTIQDPRAHQGRALLNEVVLNAYKDAERSAYYNM